MADYTTRTETTTRVIYVLPSPTNWAELGKATSAIQNDMEARGIATHWDDAVTVEAFDDEIHLWFEATKETA